jgi:exosortase
MIPLPILGEIGFQLQAFSARNSAWLGRAIGLPITATGAEIHLEGSTFVVGLPCSGLNTLIALLALAAIFIYLLRGPFYKKAILFALGVPIAIFANVFRIVFLLLVANYFGAEAVEGFIHGLSSLIFFLIAFLCLAILARLFRCSLEMPSGGK